VARIVDIAKERMNKGVTGGIGYKVMKVTQRRGEDKEGWKQVKRMTEDTSIRNYRLTEVSGG